MRESGFRWVVWDGCEQVAYWPANSEGWYLTGMPERLSDADFDQIDERRIVREVE